MHASQLKCDQRVWTWQPGDWTVAEVTVLCTQTFPDDEAFVVDSATGVGFRVHPRNLHATRELATLDAREAAGRAVTYLSRKRDDYDRQIEAAQAAHDRLTCELIPGPETSAAVEYVVHGGEG